MKTSQHRISRRSAATQQGAVLVFTLIVLVVLLIGGVALVRSFDTTLFSAGNIAFKRDLANQGELVIPRVLQVVQTGALATAGNRSTNNPGANYSATILPVSPQGVPLVLVNDSAFGSVGNSANDIRDTPGGQGVTVRYIVDRMCNAQQPDAVLGSTGCVLADAGVPLGGTGHLGSRIEDPGVTPGGSSVVPQQVVYRISVRVTGPRNTQTFLQTTFTL